MPIKNDEVILRTRRWLEKSVIGLNLCPFAEAPYRADRVRYCVSEQRSASGLLDELRAELLGLQAADPSRCETALLIHPWVLVDFLEYNEFLDVCDTAVAELGLEGELQVASSHPQYQFAETESEDIENYTNRSPYPMLHLLREDSIAAAVEAGADAEAICSANSRTLEALGFEGWAGLWRSPGR